MKKEQSGNLIVYETNDYSLFKFGINRAIKETNLKHLNDSLKIADLGNEYPIIVSKDFVIKDGQHRFEARKKLGLPIYYLQSDRNYDPDEVILANVNTFRWNVESFLEVKAKLGNVDCKNILKDAKSHNVPVNIFCAVAGISISVRDVATQKIKYTPLQKVNACELFSELEVFKIYPFWNHLRFIKAYMRIRTLNNFDFKKMKNAIQNNSSLLKRQQSRTNYLLKLMEVYNYNKTKENRIPYPAQDVFQDFGDA